MHIRAIFNKMIVELIELGILSFLIGYLLNKFYFSGGKCKSRNRLDGKIAIVTGGNTGLGFETALELAKRGAQLIIACRDTIKAEKAANRIKNLTLNQKIIVKYLDLSDLDSVRYFSKTVQEEFEKIDILVNNAGKLRFNYT
jgi:NADP-dependent 3-hydroxy acid dehydrogenase YdfG